MNQNLPAEQEENPRGTGLFKRSTWYLILAGLLSGIAYITATALLLKAKKESEREGR